MPFTVVYRRYVNYDQDVKLRELGEVLAKAGIIPKVERHFITQYALDFLLANKEEVIKTAQDMIKKKDKVAENKNDSSDTNN